MSEQMAKTFDKGLQDHFSAYRDAGEDGTGAKPWTMRELARQLGVTDAPVSKYLSGVPEGDVEALEARIEDVLRNAHKRRASGDADLVDTIVSRQVDGMFESIRRSGHVGLVHSPAGLGKSCACRLYAARNPSSILVTVTKWNGSSGGLTNAVWESFETRKWKGNVSRMSFIVERLAGSRRLLILDSAQRLTIGGLEWLFDLYDATHISIAFVGNPEILDVIRRNDQLWSRIGLKRAIVLGEKREAVKNVRPLMSRMLGAFCGDRASEVEDLAERVCLEQGHFRCLYKHLTLADDMRQALKLNWRDAFVEANKSLAVGYRL